PQQSLRVTTSGSWLKPAGAMPPGPSCGAGAENQLLPAGIANAEPPPTYLAPTDPSWLSYAYRPAAQITATQPQTCAERCSGRTAPATWQKRLSRYALLILDGVGQDSDVVVVEDVLDIDIDINERAGTGRHGIEFGFGKFVHLGHCFSHC